MDFLSSSLKQSTCSDSLIGIETGSEIDVDLMIEKMNIISSSLILLANNNIYLSIEVLHRVH